MPNKNLSLALNIDLATSGIGKLAQGITEIKKAGVEVDGLENGLDELTRAFDDISNQQRLIEQFKSLKRESKELSNELKNGAGDSDKLKARKKALAEQLKVVRADMDKAGIAVKGLSEKEKQLTEQSKAAEKALDNLTDEAKELAAIADAKIKLGLDTDDKARKELEAVTAAYKKLEKSGKLSSTELARANELHTARVKELESQLVRTRPTINEITADLGKFATAGTAFTLIAREAMQFESAMAGVKKVVDGTPEKMAALGGEIKQLAQELGIVPEKVAEIAAAGGQLGVSMADLPNFIRLAGEMSVAFDMTAEDAANAAAKLSNVWGIPLDQVRDLGDAINTLGNNTAAREAEITAAMLRIGGNAKQFGLAATEAAALADAMIALGKPPEVAATAINALLLKLQTGQAQGKKFQAALGDIGYTADQMAANIQANPQQALSDFLNKLGELDTQSRALALADLFGAEYADDISLLVGSLGEYEKALGLVEDKTKTTGALNDEFKAQMDKAETSVTQAQIAVSNLASTLGATLLPIISATAEGVGGAASAVDQLAQQYPLLTELAVILAGAKLASLALKTTFNLLGVTGVKSAAQIATGYTGAKATIDATNVSAKALNARFGTVTTTAKGLAGKLGNVANQLSLIAAAGAGGFAFGTALRESSDIVRDIGDEMARVLAYLDAMVTDRTFEDVNNHFETSRETQARLAEQTRKTNEAIAEQERLQAAAAQAAEQAAAREVAAYQQAITTIDQLRDSMKLLEQAGETNSAHYAYLKEQVAALEPVITAYNQKLVESGKVLDNNVTKIREQEQATKAASDAFAALGVDVNQVMTGVSTDAQSAMTTFATAMDNARAAGTENMAVTQAAIQAVLDKLKSPAEFAAFNQSLKSTGALAKATAEQQKQLAEGQKATAEATKSAADAQELAATAVENIAKATREATDASQKNADAVADNTKSLEKNAQASETAGSKSSGLASIIQGHQRSLSQSSLALEHYNAGMKQLVQNVQSMSSFIEGMNGVFGGAKQILERYKEEVTAVAEATDDLQQKTQDGTVSLYDIQQAAVLAETAMYDLNDAELTDLNASIDAARKKLISLEKQAEETAKNIAGRLADATGNDEDRLNRKFDEEREELEKKRDASTSNTERDYYEQAIRDLQKLREAELKKQRQRDEQRKNTDSRKSESDLVKAVESNITASTVSVNTTDLANKFSKIIDERANKIAEHATQKGFKDFMQELHDYRKRQGY